MGWLGICGLWLLLLAVTSVSGKAHGRGSRQPKAPRQEYQYRELAQIPLVEFNDTITFHANETWLHFRTDSVPMTYRQCVQYSYFLEGKRTRMRMYMCRMNEGGRCIMEKYRSISGAPEEGCFSLGAWMGRPDEYAVHVQFERRPRKFSDKEKEARWRRRRHGRSSHRVVGRLSLQSVMNCKDVCIENE